MRSADEFRRDDVVARPDRARDSDDGLRAVEQERRLDGAAQTGDLGEQRCGERAHRNLSQVWPQRLDELVRGRRRRWEALRLDDQLRAAREPKSLLEGQARGVAMVDVVRNDQTAVG